MWWLGGEAERERERESVSLELSPLASSPGMNIVLRSGRKCIQCPGHALLACEYLSVL